MTLPLCVTPVAVRKFTNADGHIKVIVSPVPYAAVVREGYEGKWRHQAAE